MKIGSVKFFKRLILAGLALLLVAAVAVAVVLGVLYAGEKTRAGRLETTLQALAGTVTLPLQEDQQALAGTLPAGAVAPPVWYSLDPSFAYQALYPHLYGSRPGLQAAQGKVCYLTFDDGPSAVTRQVLDTLAQYGVPATFFVTGENSEKNTDVLRAIVDGGHAVGVHSYSHDYKTIYQSVEHFLEDFEKMHRLIVEETGVAPDVFRFAGGSINVHNQYVYNQLAAEMLRRGFVFYDWNVAAGDAVVGGITRQQAADNVLAGTGGRDAVIVLMHDRRDNSTTAAALPAIIEGLQKQGYRFDVLTGAEAPITFFYPE